MVEFNNDGAGVSQTQLDSIMSAMKSVEDAPRNAVWVLYGDPGSGRTALAASLSDKNILLTVEKGFTSLQNTPDLARVTRVVELSDVGAIGQIDAIVTAINAGQIECDNLILDTMTGIYERKVQQSLVHPKHSTYRRDNEGLPSWPDYQWAFQQVRPMLLKLVRAKCMVTVISHIRYPTPELIAKGETTRPDLGKAVFQLLNEECGIIAKCYRNPKTRDFMVRTQGSSNETCKSWLGMPPEMAQGEFAKYIRNYRNGI